MRDEKHVRANPDQTQRAKIAQRLAKPKWGADDGSCPPALAQALTSGELEAVVTALAATRVLLPLIVSAQCDQSQIQPLDAPDLGGQVRGIRAFSSLTTLTQAFPQARPQPVSGRQCAKFGLGHGGFVQLDDVIIPPPALSAIICGDTWLPAWRDAELRDHLAAAAQRLGLTVATLHPTTAGLPALSVPLHADQRPALTALAQELAADEVVRARAYRIELRPQRVGAASPAGHPPRPE